MPSVMGNNGEPREMSEANLLAPWRVTGKLDEAEARELDELAREDPEFAALLREMEKEAEATVALNEALGAPSASVWNRIELAVDEEKKAQSRDRIATLVAGGKR